MTNAVHAWMWPSSRKHSRRLVGCEAYKRCRHSQQRSVTHEDCYRPSLLDTRDDGSKVVVKEDHVSRLLRHVRPSDAHSDPNVGLLQRGRVVDTVACAYARVFNDGLMMIA
jgi:hypothetical protein